MRKLLMLSLVALSLTTLFTDCKKKTKTVDNRKTITVPIDRSDTTTLPTPIPAFPISFDLSTDSTLVQLDTFATKVNEYITPYGFTKSDIISLKLTALNIVLENSPGQTFNFIKNSPPSLKVYVDSFAGSKPKEVAVLQTIPTGANSINLTVDGSDIKDFFNADYMKLLVGFKTQENEGLNANTVFRVNYSFEILAYQP